MGVIVELAHFNPTEAGRVVWDTLYIVPFQIIPNQYGTDRITRDAKIITRGRYRDSNWFYSLHSNECV